MAQMASKKAERSWLQIPAKARKSDKTEPWWLSGLGCHSIARSMLKVVKMVQTRALPFIFESFLNY